MKHTEQIMAEMEAAAAEAKKEYETWLESLTPSERQVVAQMAEWFDEWHMSAGYKRLSKIVIGK